MLLMLAVRRISSSSSQRDKEKERKNIHLELVQLTISLQCNSLTLSSSHTHPTSPGCLPYHYRCEKSPLLFAELPEFPAFAIQMLQLPIAEYEKLQRRQKNNL